MSLLPVQTNCTVPNYNSDNLPLCSPKIAQNMKSYPSDLNCPNTSPFARNRKRCFIVTNKLEEGVSEEDVNHSHSDSNIALSQCCDQAYGLKGVRESYFDSCVQICLFSGALKDFNGCLEKYDYGPSYNNTGSVRDSYCIKGQSIEYVKDGKVVKKNAETKTTSDTGETSTPTSSAPVSSHTSGSPSSESSSSDNDESAASVNYGKPANSKAGLAIGILFLTYALL